MKRYGITLILLLWCFTAAFSQPPDLLRHKDHFGKELKNWTASFSNFNLSDFYPADNIPFEHQEGISFSQPEQFYALYKPVLSFSADGKSFLDIYSYLLNLEWKDKKRIANPGLHEQAVFLCNTEHKTRERIFFTANLRQITDVVWLSDKEFMLVGSQNEEEGKNIITPMIFIGNTETKMFAFYLDKNKDCKESGKHYKSAALGALNIQGLE